MVESLENIVENLKRVEDATWGAYCLNKDPLSGKLTEEKKQDYIQKSIACGSQEAKKIRRLKDVSPLELVEELGIKLSFEQDNGSFSILTLANFIEPNEIVIFKNNIASIENYLKDDMLEDTVLNHILGHEIFHYLQMNDETLSVNSKIVLWKLGAYEHRSQLTFQGEIGAMSFCKELLGLSYSPYILDVLVLYPRHTEKSIALYNRIMQMQSQN